MTPRPPIGHIRPLAPTIAPPGSPAVATRRRGARLSWRRAARIAAAAPARHEAHHHWPLTVNLLFRSTVAPPATSPVQPAAATKVVPGPVAKPRTLLIWERRDAARSEVLQAVAGRPGSAPQLPATESPLPSAMRPNMATAESAPVFVRTLASLVEQRWLRSRMTLHLPIERSETGAARRPRGNPASTGLLRSRRPDLALDHHAPERPAAFVFPQSMRFEDRPLFTADPLVRRSLRRISITPSMQRSDTGARAATGLRSHGPVRRAADVALARPRIARARPAEQVWPDPRTAAAGGSFAQPFAPIFPSSGNAAPAIAVAAAPVAAPTAAVPDVDRLVDEVMRRIERQTRLERQRRGM